MPWDFFVSPTQSPLCLSDARCQNESSAYRRITHASFSNNCYYQISGAAVVAELAEVDSLPCAEVQTAIGDGDGDADTAQCRFGVSRHIVGTFQRMLILRTILRNQAVEDSFHIHANIRVAVLVDAQSATGVLREDVHDARLRLTISLVTKWKPRRFGFSIISICCTISIRILICHHITEMFLAPGDEGCKGWHKRLADFGQGILYTGWNLWIYLAMDEVALLQVLQCLREHLLGTVSHVTVQFVEA